MAERGRSSSGSGGQAPDLAAVAAARRRHVEAARCGGEGGDLFAVDGGLFGAGRRPVRSGEDRSIGRRGCGER
jgi:hypothetical protein